MSPSPLCTFLSPTKGCGEPMDLCVPRAWLKLAQAAGPQTGEGPAGVRQN